MRFIPGVAGLVLAGAVVLGLGACFPPGPRVIPTAQPTVPPVFASADEALAAAKKAFDGYNIASDQIAADGGKDPNRIAKWVAPAWLPHEVEGSVGLAKSGRHLKGTTKIISFSLQEFEQSPTGLVTIGAYVCVDISGARLMDSSNRDVTPSSRATVLPLQVEFENLTPASPSVVLSESGSWSGRSFCS